jgi:hypothetical protein
MPTSDDILSHNGEHRLLTPVLERRSSPWLTAWLVQGNAPVRNPFSG